jgi:hypothetical protein
MNNMYARFTQGVNVKVEEMHLGLQAVTMSLDTLNKNFREELNVKLEETHLGFQALTMTLNKRTKNLCEELKAKITKTQLVLRSSIIHGRRTPEKNSMWDPRDSI